MEFLTLQTLISTDRLANIIRFSELVKDLEGDCAEFGVFRGGSLELIAKLNPGKTVWGIDSFEGLPVPCEKDNYHKQGDFSETSYEDLRGYFAIQHRNVNLLKGFSPGVFKEIHPHKKFSFVHIDVDLYQSVKDGIDYFWPRMVDGGVILFDDYGWESTEGAKIAIDDFVYNPNNGFSKKERLSYGQLIVGNKYQKQFYIIK